MAGNILYIIPKMIGSARRPRWTLAGGYTKCVVTVVVCNQFQLRRTLFAGQKQNYF